MYNKVLDNTKESGNFHPELNGEMMVLKGLFTLSSIANMLAGAVLILTWGSNWASDPERHVPIVVLAIGGAMMIQGLFSAAYSGGWWKSWGEIASGAMLAGQLISGCVGVGILVAGIAHNVNAANNDGEMVPVLAGLLIAANALLGLLYLFNSADGEGVHV